MRCETPQNFHVFEIALFRYLPIIFITGGYLTVAMRKDIKFAYILTDKSNKCKSILFYLRTLMYYYLMFIRTSLLLHIMYGLNKKSKMVRNEGMGF